jgi:hypothetical protein
MLGKNVELGTTLMAFLVMKDVTTINMDSAQCIHLLPQHFRFYEGIISTSLYGRKSNTFHMLLNFFASVCIQKNEIFLKYNPFYTSNTSHTDFLLIYFLKFEPIVPCIILYVLMYAHNT